MHAMSQSEAAYFLGELGLRWYLDFTADMSQAPSWARKVPFIQVPVAPGVWTSGQAEAIESLSDDQIAALGFLTRPQVRQMAQASPGAHWYVFGEANRYYDGATSSFYITGARFAPVFHYFYTELKLADPTARIIGPSVLNWEWTCYLTCFYMQGATWLQDFISAYNARYSQNPPVDAWAIDAYPIDWLRTPNNAQQHAPIVFDQLTGMRAYLDGFPEYRDTPIWITEIAAHVGYDGWEWVHKETGAPCSGQQTSQGKCKLDPVGSYHWDVMSDYLLTVLDWLDANAASYKIARWFFFITWKDIVNVGTDGYMGPIFFDGPAQGASRNCLGNAYRARALDIARVKCDAAGNTVPAGN